MSYEEFAQLCEKAGQKAVDNGGLPKQAGWAMFLKHISTFPTDGERFSMFLGLLEGLLEDMYDNIKLEDELENEVIKCKMKDFMLSTLGYSTIFEE